MYDRDTTMFIDTIVKEWIGQGRAFTVYEITKEMQERLKASGSINWSEHRHQNVRDYYAQCQPLNDEVEFGDYSRTLVDVGQGLQANLYHPKSYDPASYKPMNRPGHRHQAVPAAGITAVASSTPSISSVASAPTATATVDDDVYEPNVSDELWVPIHALQAADFHPGDVVYVFANNGEALLAKDDDSSNGTLITTKRVEQRGNVRLGKGLRARIFNSPNEKYVVEADSNLKLVMVTLA